MNRLVAKLQKDIEKLQQTIQKESNELLEKVRSIDLKENFEHKKKEVEKTLAQKLKKLEPAYHQFMNELKKNASKAGIDLDKIEKEIMSIAAARLQKTGSKTSSRNTHAKKTAKKVSKVKKNFTSARKTVKKTVPSKKTEPVKQKNPSGKAAMGNDKSRKGPANPASAAKI